MERINCSCILVMLALFCSTTNSATLATAPSPESADSFWNKTTSELWGPSSMTCQNDVFPLKTLAESKKIGQDFAECHGHLTSQDPLEKLCISAVYNLKYVCRHKVESDHPDRKIAESEISKFEEDEKFCENLSKSAAPIATNCGVDRACNLTSETAFDLKQKDKLEPYCVACKRSVTSRYTFFRTTNVLRENVD